MVTADRLLIVDDDNLLLALLNSSLSESYDVITANSETQVLTLLDSSQTFPSVVLLDLGLPPMTHTAEIGLSLLTQIIQCHESSKVIVLTGQDHEAVAFQALSLGAFDFIAKPASADVILYSLKRAFLFIKQESQAKAQGRYSIKFSVSGDSGLKNVRNEAEKRLFLQVWHDTDRNVHQVARRLGIKRENVYYLLDKFGITRADS